MDGEGTKKPPSATPAGGPAATPAGPPAGRGPHPSYLERDESRLIVCAHIFNALIFIMGLGAAAVSLWVWIMFSRFESRDGVINLLGPLYYVANFTAVGEGGVLIFVVAIGTIGLCFRSRLTLVWYFGLLLLLCAVSLVLVIISLTLYFELTDTLRSGMMSDINDHYGALGFESATQNIDNIQTEFKCCGWDAYTDWESSRWYQSQVDSRVDPRPLIPSSCCVTANDTAPTRTSPSSSPSSTSSSPSSTSLSTPAPSSGGAVYVNETGCTSGAGGPGALPNHFMNAEGCQKLLKDPLDTWLLILAGVGFGLFLVQFICLAVLINLFRMMGPRSPSQMTFRETDTAREALDKLDYWLDRESEEIKRQSAQRKKKMAAGGGRKSIRTLSEKT